MTAVAVWNHLPTAKELLDERLARGWLPTASDLRQGDKVLGFGACAVAKDSHGKLGSSKSPAGTVSSSQNMSASLSEDIVSAVVGDDTVRVAGLLDAGHDVNARNERGETAFSYACANNSLAVAKLLVARGADINTKDAGGGSPLDWAVCHSSPEFRDWLSSIGAARNDKSYEPWPWPPIQGDCGPSTQTP